MNKVWVWIAGIIMAVALFFGATWLTASMAHERLGLFVERLTEQCNGQLRVVERKASGNLFSSVEDITFAIDNPILAKLLAPPTDRQEPLQFTVRNVIAYGPLPGLRSVGLARIEASLLLADDQRKILTELLGTDKPLAFLVTLGIFGTTQVDVTSPALTVPLPGNAGVVTWKGMQARSDYSLDFGEMKMSASAPGLMVASNDGVNFGLDDLQFSGALQRKFETLYVGEESLKIAAINVTQSSALPAAIQVKDIVYAIQMSADQEFYNLGARMGAASFAWHPALLKDLHCDFAVKHLHGPTMASLSKILQNASSGKSMSDPAWSEQLQAAMLTLLQNSPELVVEHVGFATDAGDLKITALAKLKEVTAQDFAPEIDFNRLVNKVAASADVSIAQALIDNWPIGVSGDYAKQSVAQLEKQGYVLRQGNRLAVHLEFNNGAMTANGQPVAAW